MKRQINAGDVSNAEVGDIIQIRKLENGTWRYYHTYVVDDVDGTSGNRTNANIWVSAHTTDRFRERLDTIIGSSQSNLRLIEILGYYKP